MLPAPRRCLTRLLPVMGIVASALVFFHFDRVPVTHHFYGVFLATMISLVTAGSLSALHFYSYRCARNVFWVFHGLLFLALTALATAHAVDYWFGKEMLGANQTLIRRVLYLQLVAASVLALPSAYPELSSGAPDRKRAIPRENIAVYVFVALYPVLHYVTNNTDAFTPTLLLQFVLIAALLPAALFCVLLVYVRPLVSDRLYYLCGVGTAIAIHAWYMRPLHRDLSTAFAGAAGVQWEGFSVTLPISLVLLVLVYKLRPVVAPFLSIFLLLLMANFGYTQYRYLASSPNSEGEPPAGALRLSETPSIYILVVDGYQNREGLREMGLEHLSAGPSLTARGFRLYDGAYSNYKPSVESITSFLGVGHHYYRPKPNWQALMTG